MTKKLNGKKSKKKSLTKKVLKTLNKINNLEKKGVELAITAGSHLSQLQKITKKEGDGWEKYVKKHFCISIRTVQRYIKISQRTDIKEHPALISLGQTLILDLITALPEEDNIGNFLRDELEIETDIDLDDEKDVKSFRFQVDEFLSECESEDDVSDDDNGIDSDNWDDDGDDDLEEDDLEEDDLEEDDLEEDDLEDDESLTDEKNHSQKKKFKINFSEFKELEEITNSFEKQLNLLKTMLKEIKFN